jgi:hypothetical protein
MVLQIAIRIQTDHMQPESRQFGMRAVEGLNSQKRFAMSVEFVGVSFAFGS